jgi:hypothetical protein
VTSASFALIGGPAGLLRVRTQPANAMPGQPLTVQPVVEVTDDGGNIVSSSAVVVTASIATGSGSITGGTAPAVNGVATFTELAVIGQPGQRTLTFAAAGLVSVTSAAFTVTSGVPARLIVQQQPGTGISGEPLIGQPVVAVTDADGYVVTNYSGTVTATVTGGVAAVSSATVAVVNGLARFQSLTVTGKIGFYTLQLQSGSLPSATSGPFELWPGRGVRLVIRTPPPSTVSDGVPIVPPPEVEVHDASGNVAWEQATITLVTDATSGTIVNGIAYASGGLARFVSLALVGPFGERNYRFTAPGLLPTPIIRITIGP